MFGEDFDFYEKKYKQAKGTFGEEYEIDWVGTREENEYIKIGIQVKLHTWDCETVEIIEKGKKVKKTKGRMELKVFGDVDTDWQGRWKGSKFKETLKKLYEFIRKREIEIKYEDKVYYMAYDLHSKIKKLLNMESS